MLRMLFEYEYSFISTGDENENNVGLKNLMICHDVYFIPVVNLDGFHEIQRGWNEERELNLIRKNMRPQTGDSVLDKECAIGVDLNRNYDFAFAFDKIGSSNDRCYEDYRG